jgi:hypothetical protein
MKILVKAGSTSRRIAIFIADSSSTTGAGLPGLTSGSTGLVCYYWREDQGNAGATQLALAAGTRGTWSSGGFVEKDAANMPGWYELGLSDAAIAGGAKWVTLLLKGATNMAPLPIEIQLVAYDPDDAVRLGLSALPNAAAGANGGLPLGDAAGRVDVGKWLGTAAAAPATAGIPKVAIEAAGDFAQGAADKVWATAARALTDKVGFALSAAGVQAIWDAAVANLTTVGSIGKRIVDFLTGDAFARLGAPVGASISADIASVQADTDNLQTRVPAALVGGRMDASVGAYQAGQDPATSVLATPANKLATDGTGRVTVGANADKTGYGVAAGGITAAAFAANAIDAVALDTSAGQEIADRILARSMAGGADGGGRTIQNALRRLMNRVRIAAGVLTVYQEDDATAAFTQTVTTVAGNPVSEVDTV